MHFDLVFRNIICIGLKNFTAFVSERKAKYVAFVVD